MKCVSESKIFKSEIVIKKSKFITSIKYVTTKDQAKEFIDEIKLLNPKANHNCYAFICGLEMGCDDAKEPAKTAGEPMLNVLVHNEINNICVVVTRYFGGIKLGASGLTRAYSKSVSEAIKSIDFIDMEKGYRCSISFDYKNVKVIDYFLKSQNIKIYSKEFEDKIVYKFEILKNKLKPFKALLKNIDYTIEVFIVKEIYIKMLDKGLE